MRCAEDYRPDDETQKALLTQLGFLDADIAAGLVLFFSMLNGLRVDLKAIALGQLDSHGYAASREGAMAAFAKSWRRE
jgi:hypothetical protein